MKLTRDEDSLQRAEYGFGYQDSHFGRQNAVKERHPDSCSYDDGLGDEIFERTGEKPKPKYYLKVLENGKFDSSKANMSKMVNDKLEYVKWKIVGEIKVGNPIKSQKPDDDGNYTFYEIKVVGIDTLYLVPEEPEKSSFLAKLFGKQH